MIVKRNFVIPCVLLLAGMLAASNYLFAQKKKIAGLQLYTLREQLPKDVKGVIKQVAAAGYKEVETYGYSKDKGFWGLTAAEFSKLLKANGLTTPSGHYGMDLYLEEEKFDDLDAAIAAAKAIGQQYVTVPFLNEKYRKTAADLKSFAAKLNEMAKRVKAAGLKLAYHNHNFEFIPVEGVMLYDVLLKETDPSLVYFEMDLYWVVRAGQDPVKWLQQYPGRFVMVHIKDMDKAKPELNTEVGKGTIDFSKILPAAKAAGVKHFIVEQENFAIDPYVSIGESEKYLEGTLLKRL